MLSFLIVIIIIIMRRERTRMRKRIRSRSNRRGAKGERKIFRYRIHLWHRFW